MPFRSSTTLSVCCGVLALLISGCGVGDIGQVSGVVTLDGEPLPNALIEFQPVEPGRSSYAETDEEGRYTIQYTFNRTGAKVGTHIVRIRTASKGDAEADIAEVAEILLPRYHYDSELEKVVLPGAQQIDIELSSDNS